ncbi:MAG: Gfo/Idh/MocA family protein [Lachnospiraceae bacterium]|jgi:predicted dehydrogenase
MSSEVRTGIVGVGNMGSAHAQHIARGDVPGMRLTAVCDNNPAKLKLAEERLGDGIRYFSSYEDLLSDPDLDAVIIAVPHPLHPVIAAEALKKGLNVLTEKPAGIDTASVRKVNEIARASGKVYGIMFNQRTNELYAKLRELMQNGTLGEMKRFVWIISNWYRTQAYYDSGEWRATWNGEGGGVLMNQCPHNLDLWQWIAGMPSRIRAVCRVGQYHDIRVEDDAVIYAEYANGANGIFITSTGEYPGTNRLEISCTRGKAVIENGTLTLSLLDEDERVLVRTSKNGFEKYPVHEVRISQTKPDSAHIGILKNFTDAILHGTPLLAPGTDGIYELTLCNAAYLSSWTDSWVDLPLDEEKYLKFLREKQQKEKSGEGNRARRSDESITAGEYSDRWSVRWN